MRKTLNTAICVGLIVLPAIALAGYSEYKNPLEGQPAVRHREEVRSGRFEIGPSVSFSLNRFVRHAILIGGKLEYHIADYLSLGADLGYGVGIDTGLTSELAGQYANDAARWEQLRRRFADIQFAGDARLSFTPFTGKMALFSKIFLGYDFYGFGGFGFAKTKNNGSNVADFGANAGDDIDAANEGFRAGAAFGAGIHLFFNQFVALGIEFKDILFSDNESGGDLTRGLTAEELAQKKVIVNADDRKFSNHFFVGLNLTFYLPTKAEISR